MSFEIVDAPKFIKGIDAFLKQLDVEVAEIYRGWSVRLFYTLLDTTPQWTGNAVANWNFSVGSPDYSSDNSLMLAQASKAYGEEDPPKQMGHPVAIALAHSNNSGNENSVAVTGGLLPSIFITNASKGLADEAYAGYLEENAGGFLRRVNEPGHMVAYAVRTYGNLGALTSPMKSGYRGAHI